MTDPTKDNTIQDIITTKYNDDRSDHVHAADDTLSGDEDFQDARENIDSPESAKNSLKRFQFQTGESPEQRGPNYHVLEKDSPGELDIKSSKTLRRSKVADGTVNKLMATFERKNHETGSLDKKAGPLNKASEDLKIRLEYELAGDMSVSKAAEVSHPGQEAETDGKTEASEVAPPENVVEESCSNFDLYTTEKIYDTPPSTPLIGCKQGHGMPVSVMPVDDENNEYDHLKTAVLDNLLHSYDHSVESKRHETSPLELSTRSCTDRRKSRRRRVKKSSTVGTISFLNNSGSHDMVYDDSDIYEELILASDDELDGWGSSEFEDYSEDDVVDEQGPHKPLPMKPKPKHEAGAPGLISRIKSFRGKKDEEEDDDARCFPVNMDPGKHPPPELPPLPDGLTENQKKRRCVIEQIISSEKSYISSLERIIRGYESTVLDHIGGVKTHTRTVFKESREILSHHQMFQIEMADRVKKWDEDEKMGDIFTASFSKSMLVDAYSVYVNNFAVAMEEIKSLQRSRQNFRDFLKLKESTSRDRLSIFGLMVKPVQRFPQFIMFLQDLVKYTPKDHHDRGALQLALTELENVTHRLNERKRHSEQTFLAKQITNQLLRQITKQVPPRYLPDKTRRLIRQNDFEQVVSDSSGQMRVKVRRLILMDDTLLCIKVGSKEIDGIKQEKFKLKWLINLSDVDLKDSAITPDMETTVAAHPGKFSIWTTQIERAEEDPFHLYADLSEILHDFTVLGQMSGLMASLKRSYQGYGLSEDLLHEITKDLQKMIQIKDEQLRLVNSCSFILADKGSVNKTKYVFQTPTPNLKHEWCVDFLMAKLALDKCNNPGWEMGQNSEEKSSTPAYFMRALSVDVPRNFTKVKCAVPVFIPSSSSVDLGVQHLWVCSSNTDRGQVSVISIHNPKPCLTEAFKATDVEIECMVSVPGLGSGEKSTSKSFVEDTVWIATVKPQLIVYSLTHDDGMKRGPIHQLSLPHQPCILVYVAEKVFCGLKSGTVLVYQTDEDGVWNFDTPVVIELGTAPIKTILDIDGLLWVACGGTVHLIDISTLQVKMKYVFTTDNMAPIDQIARAGVGIWVSFKNRAFIRLYHIETLETLQEINIASPIAKLIEHQKPQGLTPDSTKHCSVTCLAAGRGMLWIGTSLGFILTLPLPRLRDGVPLVNSRPNVSYHGHNFPVKFIIPIYCSTSVAHLEKKSSFRSSIRPRKLKVISERIADASSSDKNETTPNSSAQNGSAENQSVDSEKVVMRRSSDSKHATMPARPKRMSFRTELAEKISSRDASSSNPDLYSQEREVQMLYETLLTSDNSETETAKMVTMDARGSNSSGSQNEINETSQTMTKKTETKSQRKLTQEIREEKNKTVVLSTKTLHKSTTNSVIVVSGGDGYSKWNSNKSTSFKNEEAVLLLWIYKF
ncbi:rho guanine nucleotide exchange factor 10 [Patella vulgata]|uniref:rho guanine nucleotide exchange factor 10 n=1 Tax=Patella vulgata TaxID=6465 RepID=UPI0024A8AE5A|nr:rho guanine nucleotide exchange factor 10 [Patella vulgata]